MDQMKKGMILTGRLKNVVMFIAACTLFMSCEEEADLSRDFIIPEGEHYASPRIVQSLQSNTLSFSAKFNETAMYHFDDAGLQDSKNKLLGFSDCNSLHHDNSARFAWQWYNDQLEIYAYCYVNGERAEKFIGVVKLHEINRYELKVTGENYVFQLNNQEAITIKRGNVCDKGIYYMLWPYFGGTIPAPHDVHISLKID
jgi:hypothetical protein